MRGPDGTAERNLEDEGPHTFVKKRDTCCECLTAEETQTPIEFFKEEVSWAEIYQNDPKKVILIWSIEDQGYQLKDFKSEALDDKVTPQEIQLMITEVNQCPPPRIAIGALPLIPLVYGYVFGLVIFFLPYLLILISNRDLPSRHKAIDLGIGIPLVFLSMITALVVTIILIKKTDNEYKAKRATLINYIFSDHLAKTFKDESLNIWLSTHGSFIQLIRNVQVKAPELEPVANEHPDPASQAEPIKNEAVDPPPSFRKSQEEKKTGKSSPEKDEDQSRTLLNYKMEESASPALFPKHDSALIQTNLVHVKSPKDV